MKEKQQKELTDDFDYLSNAASATDCTGLIPSLAQNEEQLESYNEIIQYMSPAAKSKKLSEETASPDKKPLSSARRDST